MKCPNCNGVMTCGCQRRKLPNGKIGCSNCDKNLKNNLNNKSTQTNNNLDSTNTNS